MAKAEFPNQIRDAARAEWHRYIGFFTPFRPELFKYCRLLAMDVWDAEDLVQDTMVRGFGMLSQFHRTIEIHAVICAFIKPGPMPFPEVSNVPEVSLMSDCPVTGPCDPWRLSY